MSVPLTVYYCSLCDFKSHSPYNGEHFYYELTNGKRLKAPTSIGWCLNCETLRIIHVGLSPVNIRIDIENSIETIKKENKYMMFKKLLKIYEWRHIEILSDRIRDSFLQLSILADKCSLDNCTTCGSTDVFILDRLPQDTEYSNQTQYCHIGCGGQIRKRVENGLRFINMKQSICLKPRFIS
jgi:hypothetical protein